MTEPPRVVIADDQALVRTGFRLILAEDDIEVVAALTAGASGFLLKDNAELAGELHLSEATIKTHIARILAKLGLRDRVQAVVVAYQSGLVVPGTQKSEADGLAEQ